MRKLSPFAIVAGSLLASSAPARADQCFPINEKNTTGGFSVGFSIGAVVKIAFLDPTTRGEFTKFNGTLTLNPDNPADDRLIIRLDSRSIRLLNNTKWQDKVTGNDFFKAARFPEIYFTSMHVARTGSDTAAVTGNLTLTGATGPIELDVRFLGKSGDSMKFEAHGAIPRSEFGITNLLGIIDNEVRLNIATRGGLKPGSCTP